MNTLLKKLNSSNIKIDLVNGKLDIQAPKGVMTADLLTEIKMHKEALIDFISKYKSQQGEHQLIPKLEEQLDYTLSSAQRRLWLIHQFEEGTEAYNMPSVYELKGQLSPAALHAAFLALIKRHEALRTNFKQTDAGEIRQHIRPMSEIDFQLPFVDVSEDPEIKNKTKAILNEEITYSFDLSADWLIRARLIKTAKHTHVIVCVMHHIISDGQSLEILGQELFAFYQGFATEREISLPALPIQFTDYAAWQQAQLDNEEAESHKAYWSNKFSGSLPILDVPTYQPRPIVKTFTGKLCHQVFERKLFTDFQKLCKGEGGTLFMGLLSVLKTLLFRYSNQPDLIIGSPIAGRVHADLENQIGMYVNVLALRTTFEAKDSFKALLAKVKETTLGAFEHQIYPFDELVESLKLKRDLSRNPLFDIVINLQRVSNSEKSDLEIAGLKISELNEANDVLSKFDLEFVFLESEKALELQLTYNPDIYADDFIKRLMIHFKNLLELVVLQSDVALDNLDFLSAPERHQLIHEFNDSKTDFQRGITAIDLFENVVATTPDKTAVVFEGLELSYQALNEVANQLANFIRDRHDLKPDDVIAVKLDRSEVMIIALLGILKSGAAYVPIDVTYPPERVKYIVEDSEARFVIDEQFIEAFKEAQGQISSKNIKKINKPTDLAYVIYTSGTSGNPKGVMVEHHNLVNFVQLYALEENSKSSLTCNYSFDASVMEIFVNLLAGSTLYIPEYEVVLSPQSYAKYIADNQINHCYVHPMHLQELATGLQSFGDIVLRRILIGTEPIKMESVKYYLDKKVEVINAYGPTECTIIATFYRMDSMLNHINLPIGRPVSNCQIYILDERFQPVPIGIAGKIFIAGAGVARGYLNRPELTNDKFLKDPFIEKGRMYDSGDMGKWMPDGNIEFLGRKDHQVKIRGYRIELGEIEHAILEYSSALKQVVVNVKENQGEKVLVAYLVAANEVDKANLREYLQNKLPDYMVPGFYIALEQLPLTPNGKIDRKALPAISGEAVIRQEYVAPSNAEEEKLVAIWQEVLGLEKIGVLDNFFELGGHSLIIAQVINKVQKQLGKTISFKTFFSHPTIKGLSQQLLDSDYLPIPKAAAQSAYPLTASQSRLWVLSQLEDGSAAYNMPAAVRFNGNVNGEQLAAAFQALIERHEVLRTSFKANEEGDVHQYILPAIQVNFKLKEKDFRKTKKQKEAVEKYLETFGNQAFDLEAAPLVRAALLQVKAKEYVFFFSMHHIIGDGWSTELLIAEIIQLYNGLVAGEPAKLPALSIQYKDYAVWLNEGLQQEKRIGLRAILASAICWRVARFGFAKFQARPLMQTYNGAHCSHQFSQDFLNKLQYFSKAHDATLFMTLMAGINILLHKYTGQEDIIIGTPIAGREHPDLENQIGLYLNTLAIRTPIDSGQSFEALLALEKEKLLGAYDHQNYRFDALVGQLNLKRDTSRSALFDVLVVLQNQGQLRNKYNEELANIAVSSYEFESHHAQRDVSFTFTEGEGLGLTIEYNTDIYDAYLIQRMFAHLENILSIGIEQPSKTIGDLQYLTAEEKQQVIQTFNDTKVDTAADQTIIDLIELQVERTPDDVAVVFEERSLSYQTLNAQANQLAHYLRSKYALQPDDLIGIKLDRSEQMLVAMLGILKSGAAYVPIDTSYPQERIAYIEKDSESKIVIDEKQLEQFYREQEKYPSTNPEKINTGVNLAYVIYTSGTTGNPKGVMVENRNAVEMIHWSNREFDAKKYELLYAATSYCFDLSVYELFYPLSIGKKIRILRNGLEIKKYITEDQNILINTVPSVTRQLLGDNTSLKNVKMLNMAGEILPIDLIKKLPLDQIEVRNLYGPSEDTTYSTSYFVSDAAYRSILIGKPISNSQVYILDEQLQPTAVGVQGKIYTAGNGVTRGYLKKPALTAEKFMSDPFVKGNRMYDTGDLGCWLADGNIEFFGRKDQQVKIRGYRIELGEIEHAILEFSSELKQAAVAVKESQGEKVLVAYLVAANDVDKANLREYLQNKLPDYMVPGFYIALEQLPLTPNGKIDRKALPAISGEAVIRQEYVAPSDAQEEKLAAIWQEVLGLEKIGVLDNFFELGGHSLIIAQVINKAQKQLGKTISFKTFFSHPTIKGLSQQLLDSDYLPIPKAAAQSAYPLTASQSRLWVLSQLEDGSAAYNMPAAVRFKGDLNGEQFAAAFQALIERHEILRTSFKANKEGEVHQYILPIKQVDFRIEAKDFRKTKKQKEAITKYLETFGNQAFDLEAAPLVRAALLQVKAKEYVFFFSMHHIIGDGWSTELLIAEIIQLYNGLVAGVPAELPALSIQYKDYAVWLNEDLQQEKELASEQYWQEQFAGELPVLDLPSFKPRPLMQTYNGAHCSHQFSQDFLNKLQYFSKAHDATLFMTLMAGINILLHKYTGQDDIIIGTPIAGREHPDLENQIGLYLNTLAIRTQIDSGQSFEALLALEKEKLLGAYDHQNYRFDALVGQLNLKRDTSRSALFDVLVVLQNQGQLRNKYNEELANIAVSSYEFESHHAQRDVSFTFTEGEGLELTIEYNTDIYDVYLIQRMFAHLENILSIGIEQPSKTIGAIQYLTAEEKQQVIQTFNDTKVDTTADQTIVDLIELQVERTPDDVAVVFEESSLSYQALNAQANQLAHYLRAKYALQPDDLIGIKLDRSEQMLVAILGILKSGAAYVPIDTSFPQERIAYIEKDSQSKIVIDEKQLQQFHQVQEKYPSTNPEKINTGADLAYVIYTSGTTGNPKGVMVENRNTVEMIHWSNREFDAKKYDLLYAATSYCFDLSVYELFYPLSIGKKIRILRNGLEIKKYITEDQNVLINTVPSVTRQLLEDNASLKNVKMLNMAGEILPIDLVKKLPLDQIEVRNLYGPSEDTTYSTSYFVSAAAYRSILIGKPISNSQVYILDEQLQPTAVGVQGKIYTAGNGVTRGYLKKPALTAEKFMSDPFRKGNRMYDTGDLGCWLADGNIEFFGRKDQQVKIRGYRIELGEIESTLFAYSGLINQVVVAAKTVRGEKALAAYYVSDVTIDKSALRSFLLKSLPEYKVPSFYIELTAIPLTANGKKDRSALPEVSEKDIIRKAYKAPSDTVEQQLVDIWQEVLNLEQVGVSDNFFELGGHSLMVIQVLNRIENLMGETISNKLFFMHATIEDLAKLIANPTKDFSAVAKEGEDDEPFLLF